MRRSGMTGQRLVALFMMGWVLLNFPILSLFSGSAEVLGIPVLYAYVFGVWSLLVGLMAFVIERKRE